MNEKQQLFADKNSPVFMEGYHAYEAGKPHTDNPYDEDKEHVQWGFGWLFAHNDHRKGNTHACQN